MTGPFAYMVAVKVPRLFCELPFLSSLHLNLRFDPVTMRFDSVGASFVGMVPDSVQPAIPGR